jgi:putative transposase
MSLYHRYFVQGGTFFFTVVTDRRVPIFDNPAARSVLGSVLRRCIRGYPMDVVAIALLPDHLHALWTLPPGDANYSQRWSWTKSEFTKRWLALNRQEQPQRDAHNREGRRGVWQRRFWEHTVRDEDDLEAHFDYIHYNPVKHSLAARPRDWPWSTFHRWAARGHYQIDWGAGMMAPNVPGNAGE